MNVTASECLVLALPAKLNLFLHVLGRRQDGLHELQTLFQLLDYIKPRVAAVFARR